MLVHWIWLAECDKVTPRQKRELLETFGDPETLFYREDAAIKEAPSMTGEAYEALKKRDLKPAEAILARCSGKEISLCALGDPAYPELLRQIPDPPFVLYYRGKLPEWNDTPVVAVVGTRKASGYGLGIARKLGYQIAGCGGILVSGGAKGIDSEAMQGALTSGGTVVGVLGCGADILYPKSSAALYEKILEKGCLITEYPPGIPPYGWNFPRRNRIISGISNGVAVVEAPERSGALITAAEANEQGRDVFVVPGNVDVPTFVGSNGLLRSGAIPILDGYDVMVEYQSMYPEKVHPHQVKELPKEAPVTTKVAQIPKMPKSNPNPPVKPGPKPLLSPAEAQIVGLLRENPSVDDAIAASGLPAAKVLAMLTMLEIRGVVKQLPGKRVSVNN